MKNRTLTSFVLVSLFWTVCASGADEEAAKAGKLPSPKEFDPARYAGKWFEAARLPTPMQPAGSLATADYSVGDEAGSVEVKNTAYDSEGTVIASIKGKAILVEGEPKGRLKVGFGPTPPSQPNYCILKVDPNYRIAVVGSPDRQSLWILAREVPLKEKRLKRLAAFAEKAGYDSAKLVISNWPADFAENAGEPKPGGSKLSGIWSFQIDGPDGEKVEIPLLLEVNEGSLTGKIGRGEDAWLELKDTEIDGDSFAFSIERDRPGGGSMTYRISGSLAENKLGGTTKTQIDGNEVTREWEAVRVKDEEKAIPTIAGNWTLQLSGPDGQDVELPMELEVDGTSLNGKVSLGDGRWMVLEEGTIDGSSFHFTVTRDRDGGGSMSYKLSGTLADGKLSGTATTKLGENEISSRWGAVRKQ